MVIIELYQKSYNQHMHGWDLETASRQLMIKNSNDILSIAGKESKAKDTKKMYS